MKTARRIVQTGALALILASVFLFGSNAESWCPFGGVESIYTYAREGNLVCSLGISNFYALGAVVLTVLLVRRAFCGYVCPIGALSEWLAAVADRVGVRRVQVSPRWDRVLSMGKYVVLVLILAVTWQLGELAFRGYCPAYALLGRHGADITFWAYIVAGAIAALSLFITMPFCRWFCPLAAVLSPFSRFGFTRIKRQATACTGCGRCAAACPMAIPVDQLPQVTDSRCLACMNCIDACPRDRQRAMFWGPPEWLGGAWPRATVIVVLLVCGAVAAAAAHLAPLPSFFKSRGVQPDSVACVELRIQGLTCRGRANLMVGFLERDDAYAIPAADTPGFYRLEAWPQPIAGRIRVSYDPAIANEESIRRAIVEPYFDLKESRWWMSPFSIEGYSPPGL